MPIESMADAYQQTISPKDCLTHLCQMEFPTAINWTIPFPILGLLGGILHFYSNFKRNSCKQTVENLSWF